MLEPAQFDTAFVDPRPVPESDSSLIERFKNYKEVSHHKYLVVLMMKTRVMG